MLRDYEQPTQEIVENFLRFDVKDKLWAIHQFRVLSPDSFAWLVAGKLAEYILYAEDYIPSLEHVEQQIVGAFPFIKKGEFIKVSEPKRFEELSAVESAVVYNKPVLFEDEMKSFTSDSGCDLVFLYVILEGREDLL